MTNGTTLVIGGGAIGTSVAYFLAKKGSDVVLLEQNQIASGATGRALGGVRNLFSHPITVELMNRNIEFFSNFSENVSDEFEFHRSGYLFLLRNEEIRSVWEERMDLYQRLGVNAEFITPLEVEERIDCIDVSDFEGALLGKDCGFIDPHLTTQAFANAAKAEGADVKTGTPVEDVLVSNGRVTGVETSIGRFDADNVVNATGAWGNELSSKVGVELPVDFVQHGYLVLDTLGIRDSPSLSTSRATRTSERKQTERRWSASKKAPGKPRRYAPSPSGRQDTRPREGEWTHTGHLRSPDQEPLDRSTATTPDGHPIVGETDVDGLYVACGFSGHGLMMSPTVGMAVSDAIVTGSTDVIDFDQLGPDRFDGPERLTPEAKTTSGTQTNE
ncbi:NAD(P)/FAD-dependent oxidoreductase [Haloplanus litoreus]|uniref:NAD(P)/FAD-dependent oxidoreductase n=1 Tax=Haloplanus litoreus TaxID=767515 RepID=UPI00362093D5